MRALLFFLGLVCSCGTTGPVDARPAWHGESAGGGDCQRWRHRVSQQKQGDRWLQRALWRWCRCQLESDQDPSEPLLLMASQKNNGGYLSDGIAEALADDGLSLALRRQLAGRLDGLVVGEPAAALAWGRAMMEPGEARISALRDVIGVDAHGWRGRHARALLAETAPPEEAAALLEAALEPHPSVLASLGHSEFSGSLKAAQRWLEICRSHPALACEQRASKRLSELSR